MQHIHSNAGRPRSRSVTRSLSWAKAGAAIGIGSALLVLMVIGTVLSGAFYPDLHHWLSQTTTIRLIVVALALALVGQFTAFVLGVLFRRSRAGKIALLSPLVTVVLYFVALTIALRLGVHGALDLRAYTGNAATAVR